MKLRIKRKHIGVGLIILGLMLAFIFSFILISKWESRQSAADVGNPDSPKYEPGAVFVDGKWYLPKKDIITILGIGVDKFKDANADTDGTDYNNTQQADFLMLLALDCKNKTAALLQLNRDTMTDIPILGVFGEPAGSFKGQLALSHTYGSGGKDSCLNTVKAVSDFLLGAHIDHYISFTMDAVPKITDLVGGVEVTLSDDFTMVDPAMEKGKEFNLTGDLALKYVRGRGELEDKTNISRMQRQLQYLEALKGKLSGCTADDADFLTGALKILSEYMVSDCTVNQLSEYCDYCLGWLNNGISKIPGESKKGAQFMEFYADEAALKQTVLSLLYEPYSK